MSIMNTKDRDSRLVVHEPIASQRRLHSRAESHPATAVGAGSQVRLALQRIRNER